MHEDDRKDTSTRRARHETFVLTPDLTALANLDLASFPPDDEEEEREAARRTAARRTAEHGAFLQEYGRRRMAALREERRRWDAEWRANPPAKRTVNLPSGPKARGLLLGGC